MTAGDLPLNKDPFIAFEVADKTLPYYNGRYVNDYDKNYVAYVNPTSLENWGTQSTTGDSFILKPPSGANVQPETPHRVTVSFVFIQMNQCLFI